MRRRGFGSTPIYATQNYDPKTGTHNTVIHTMLFIVNLGHWSRTQRSALGTWEGATSERMSLEACSTSARL